MRTLRAFSVKLFSELKRVGLELMYKGSFWKKLIEFWLKKVIVEMRADTHPHKAPPPANNYKMFSPTTCGAF